MSETPGELLRGSQLNAPLNYDTDNEGELASDVPDVSSPEPVPISLPAVPAVTHVGTNQFATAPIAAAVAVPTANTARPSDAHSSQNAPTIIGIPASARAPSVAAAASVAGPALRPQDHASNRAPSGPRSTGSTALSQSGARVRSAATVVSLAGRGPVNPDSRKYRYDVVRGRATAPVFEVTKDDRMSVYDAAEMLDRIHRVFGIHTSPVEVQYSFDCALWFSHTLNGSSVLQPGRATFTVPGFTEVFDMAKVRDMLGVDARRFFRAFADDIADVNRRVISDYDPYDPASAEAYGWLMQVAHSRGMQRAPYLAHDTADACLVLSTTERSLLSASKNMVISSTPNSADRVKANDRVASADRYDSTVGGIY